MCTRVGRPSSHKFVLLAAAILALIGLIAAAPLLFASQLARLTLSHLFPRNRPTLGSASISPSGALIMHELQLHDLGAFADRPLVAIHELRADFRWSDLLSRRIRQIRVNHMTVYARTNDAAQLSLLDLLVGNFATAGSNRSVAPVWIDTLDVTGTIHREAIAGFSEDGTADWPLLLSMTMSGDRRYPARQINLRIGDLAAAANVAAVNHQTADTTFGVRAEVETHPTADGTHLIFHRVAARNTALVFDADMMRKLAANFPREFEGRIEAGLADLSATGELNLPIHGSGKLTGSVSFAGVRLRAPGKSQMMLSLDDLTGSVKVDSPLPPGTATSINVVGLEAKHSRLSVDADALRRYVTNLPPEISGRVEVSIGKLTTSGELSPRGSAREQRFAASLTISGARVHVPGVSQSLLDIGDLSGGAKVDTPLPLGKRTAITIDGLKARNVIAALDSDAARKYMSKLPSDLRGPVNANLEEFDLAGSAGSPDEAAGVRGIWNVRLQNLNAKSPTTGAHAFSLDGLSATGIVETPLAHWTPASAKVRGAVTKFAAFTYGKNSISNFDATWHDDGRMIACERCALEIFGGGVSGSPAFDLVSHEMPNCDLELRAIDVHRALANLSPKHIDAEGNASGALHLHLSKQGELSGRVELAFDGPGLLKIGEIEEVKQMLIGNFGLDMANLAMHDLRHFPFKQGSLQLESVGQTSQLKIKFVRQARSAADEVTPHKEMINGKEVLVRSLVVPTIDMTIPITGRSLAEILSTVSGLTPTLEATGGPDGK